MQLFYNPNIENDLFLEKEEHTHAAKVLRKNVGDSIFITNGKGDLFTCELIQITSKKSFVSVNSKESFDNKHNLTIAIAPTKNNNRLEFFLEKATEIGIKTIQPIICDRSERKILKVERLQKIVTSAAKQSKNFNFPELKAPISFKSFIAKETTGNKYMAHCEDESSKKELYEMGLSKNAEVLILIGPEGDFTPKEIELASSNGFEELSLGESRLRTETAGIVATTLYHTLK